MPEDFNKFAEDALSFPVLTEEVSFPGGADHGGTSSGTAPIGQKVNIALREILGWRPRSNDPRGFLASLNQSFDIKEVDGHVQATWRPRTFAAKADLGAITGAQASIYTRARAALDQSLPLLDGLKPLRADHDLQDIDAARAIVRSSFTELVYELGVEGGPQLARVDGYFLDLLGPIADPNGTDVLANPEDVGGQLALLRDEFGLVGEEVNTIEEEQNLTNFFILVDSINSLWLTWRTQRSFFNHSSDGKAFLGTQFVLLSRNLAVVNESVEELNFAMNSVFLGPAERQVTKVTLPGNEVVVVGEALNWVQRFAAEEGPRLLREGGEDGVISAFRPTLDRLIRIVSGMVEVSKSPSNNPTAGFHTPRVRRSLEELKLNLETTRTNARRITRLPAPDIRLVEHDDDLPTTTPGNLLLTVSGANFNTSPRATLSVKLPGQSVLQPVKYIFVTETMIRAIFDLPASYLGGSAGLTVIVTNPDGQFAEAVLNIGNPLGIASAPRITDVQPDPITVNDDTELENFKVTVSGNDFQSGATLALKVQGIKDPVRSKRPATVTTPNKIEADFNLKGKMMAGRPVVVTVIVANPDNQQDNNFTIITYDPKVGAPLSVTSVTPTRDKITDPKQLKDLRLTITGSGFQNETEVSLNIQGKNEARRVLVSLKTSTEIEAVFDLSTIPLKATEKPIKGKVIVTNPGVPSVEKGLTIPYEPKHGESPDDRPSSSA